jgi:cytochrome c peroxidase
MKMTCTLWNWTLLGCVVSIFMLAGCQPNESKKSYSPTEKTAIDTTQKADSDHSVKSVKEPTSKPVDESVAEPVKKPANGSSAVLETAKVEFQMPLGLTPVTFPVDNPLTAEKVELGKLLYFDTRLSKDSTVSCATCHDPKKAWAENRPTSEGIGKQVGNRNSPTVINATYATSQFWDGRAKTLEEQAIGPIENPIEMGHDLDAMISDLSKLEGYSERFQKVFGTPITKDGVAKAIAAFERTVLSGNSPYDRYKAGDETALNDSQKRGLALFEDNCSTCHAPPTFSNYRFYNAGVGMDQEKPDEGRKKASGKDGDLGKFRVPALREVEKTFPYFHNGKTATLEEAVALMAEGGKDTPNLSAQIKVIRESKLTSENQKDLVEFLKSLSGEYPIVEPPKLP